nr:MAG TPA: hypothetical protein [Caudoviricetes sp.]
MEYISVFQYIELGSVAVIRYQLQRRRLFFLLEP